MGFNKYPKIETCFQRSLETKKLLDGVWCLALGRASVPQGL